MQLGLCSAVCFVSVFRQLKPLVSEICQLTFLSVDRHFSSTIERFNWFSRSPRLDTGAHLCSLSDSVSLHRSVTGSTSGAVLTLSLSLHFAGLN